MNYQTLKLASQDPDQPDYGNNRMDDGLSADVRPFFPRVAVPSGTYTVSQAKNLILEAYLGSCVGITILDREANVGGLIHLLLPEPTSKDSLWQPENNARTGLPLFIQALCDAGASKERLEACLRV